jgi:hypothetical protein
MQEAPKEAYQWIWQEERTRNVPRPHLALTYLTPLYQHLLANAGEYKISGGKS